MLSEDERDKICGDCEAFGCPSESAMYCTAHIAYVEARTRREVLGELGIVIGAEEIKARQHWKAVRNEGDKELTAYHGGKIYAYSNISSMLREARKEG